MYSECSRFHPNQFTFSRVIAKRVNTVKTHHKVNRIFGWSLALSQITNTRNTLLIITVNLIYLCHLCSLGPETQLVRFTKIAIFVIDLCKKYCNFKKHMCEQIIDQSRKQARPIFKTKTKITSAKTTKFQSWARLRSLGLHLSSFYTLDVPPVVRYESREGKSTHSKQDKSSSGYCLRSSSGCHSFLIHAVQVPNTQAHSPWIYFPSVGCR